METSLPIEKYKKIRMAQAEGARTVEDLRRMTDLVIENEEEAAEMQRILKMHVDATTYLLKKLQEQLEMEQTQ